MLIKTRIKSSTELSSYKMLTVCPLLVVTTTMSRAFSMAIVFSVTMIIAQFIVALFKKLIPLRLRSLFYVTVTAFVASVTELLVWYFIPGVAESLGIYLPILAVSCIILVRLESIKTENSLGSAIVDSLVTSAQMILVMVGAATLRELFGRISKCAHARQNYFIGVSYYVFVVCYHRIYSECRKRRAKREKISHSVVNYCYH